MNIEEAPFSPPSKKNKQQQQQTYICTLIMPDLNNQQESALCSG